MVGARIQKNSWRTFGASLPSIIARIFVGDRKKTFSFSCVMASHSDFDSGMTFPLFLSRKLEEKKKLLLGRIPPSNGLGRQLSSMTAFLLLLLFLFLLLLLQLLLLLMLTSIISSYFRSCCCFVKTSAAGLRTSPLTPSTCTFYPGNFRVRSPPLRAGILRRQCIFCFIPQLSFCPRHCQTLSSSSFCKEPFFPFFSACG